MDITTHQHPYTSLMPNDALPATNLALEVNGNTAVGRASFTREADLFQQDGIDTLVCGSGSITQTHQSGDFIELHHVEAWATYSRASSRPVGGYRKPCLG